MLIFLSVNNTNVSESNTNCENAVLFGSFSVIQSLNVNILIVTDIQVLAALLKRKYLESLYQTNQVETHKREKHSANALCEYVHKCVYV